MSLEVATLTGTPYAWAGTSTPGGTIQSGVFSSSAGTLLLALVVGYPNGSLTSDVSSLAGGSGLTWTKIAGGGDLWANEASIWQADGTGAQTDIQVTATYANTEVIGRGIYIVGFTGFNTSTPIGLHSATSNTVQTNSISVSTGTGLTVGSRVVLVAMNVAAFETYLTAGANCSIQENTAAEFGTVRSTSTMADTGPFTIAATGWGAAQSAGYAWAEVLPAAGGGIATEDDFPLAMTYAIGFSTAY